MKAAERCKEHYQGDRCRKPTGHNYRQLEPDLVHKGSHVEWTDEDNGGHVLEANPVVCEEGKL